MGQSDGVEDPVYLKHQELCSELNIDSSAVTESWKSYENIRQHYTLEGDQLHWVVCALYVAYRKNATSTSGKGNSQGNGVSLTQLLQLYKLPLIEFFTKTKSWANMCNMPQDLSARIDKLEKNFSVSSVLFQMYQPVFKDIFKYSNEEFNSQPKSRRPKAVPCTPLRLLEFCWSLFITIKSGISAISDDLVNCYHLLIVCCDLIYSNALVANRKDLLNPEFFGLPENFNDDEYTPPEKANCIVNLLCERYDAISVEAIRIKEYDMKRYMTKLFTEKTLRGDSEDFTGLLEPSNFDVNLKSINRVYEQHVINGADLDERVFLDPDANSSIGSSPSKAVNDGNIHLQIPSRNQLGTHWIFPTPLTGRRYLKPKERTNIIPALNPTQSVIRLNSLLVGCQPAPSENLKKIFDNTSSDVQSFVESKIEEFGNMFYEAYSSKAAPNAEVNENSALDFGKKRLQTAQTLFYKVLELVLSDEASKKPNLDMSALLQNVIFLQSLLACSCEIVIYSYKNEEKIFPWILKALHIEALHFFKVIEVIVKVCVDQLTRDTVKHLNRIEEMILESLAWKSTSPLWNALAECKDKVPSYEDVALPGTFDSVDPCTLGQSSTSTPITSASDRFESSQGTDIHSILRSKGIITINGSSPSTPVKNQIQSRKINSLGLFFRKFYHMTVTRMQTLCAALEITDIDIQRKIWTIFESAIMKRTHLMKDRHLDQIIMSSVYVICKLQKIEKNTFTEIVRCYRLQPQAESHIYRSVLISKIQNNSESIQENSNGQASRPPPTPSGMAMTSNVYGSDERGDLIKFYNTIFVPEVKEFVPSGLFRGNITNLMLSPLPKARDITKASPIRRVTESVITRILDPKEIVASPAPLKYCFNRSPSKDLETINKMVTAVDTRKNGKRLLTEEQEVPPSETEGETKPKLKKLPNTATAFVAKIENIIDDRRVQNF